MNPPEKKTITLYRLKEGSPCSILGATVNISSVFQQHLDNLSPAPRGRLVESCVASVIAPIHLPDVLLKTILNHILQHRMSLDNTAQRCAGI